MEKILKNNKGFEFVILGKENNTDRILVKFLNTGYVSYVDKSNINTGNIKDRLEKTILNVACIGGIKHKSTNSDGIALKEYRLWRNMIGRCYDVNHKSYDTYGGSGVEVSERWLNYQNFCEDIVFLENYNLWKVDNDGKIQLDKDIRSCYNKVYSLETCCFINQKENIKARVFQNQKWFYIMDLEENILGRFNNKSECSKQFNVHRKTIQRQLDNPIIKSKKYKFKYIEDVI